MAMTDERDQLSGRPPKTVTLMPAWTEVPFETSSRNFYLLPVRRITPRNRSGPVRSPVLDRSWAGLDLPVLISSWGIGLATVDRSELQGSIPYFRGEIADADQSGGADRSSGADRSNVTNQSCRRGTKRGRSVLQSGSI